MTTATKTNRPTRIPRSTPATFTLVETIPQSCVRTVRTETRTNDIVTAAITILFAAIIASL